MLTCDHKYLPMFDLILPFKMWQSIKDKYEFNYDLNLLYFVVHDKVDYLFTINRKLKRNIIMCGLPDEVWQIIMSYSSDYIYCSYCKRFSTNNRKLLLVCKQWHDIMTKSFQPEGHYICASAGKYALDMSKLVFPIGGYCTYIPKRSVAEIRSALKILLKKIDASS